MNAPDRLDAIRVQDGVDKITMTVDEKVTNAAFFRIAREDHTVGNLLRMDLLRDPRIKFAGYKHPHPLDNDIIVRIQGSHGLPPRTALAASFRRLEDEFLVIGNQFDEECRRIRREQGRFE